MDTPLVDMLGSLQPGESIDIRHVGVLPAIAFKATKMRLEGPSVMSSINISTEEFNYLAQNLKEKCLEDVVQTILTQVRNAAR